MIWIENRDLGKLWLGLTFIFFFYYTLWVIVLPFVDEEYKDWVSAFFPPLELALIVPSILGSSVFILLLIRAYQLVKADRDQEKLMIKQE